MPRLIKNINAVVLDNYMTNFNYFSSLSAEVQFEDYIDLNGFIAYLQNFTQVDELDILVKPLKFGLKNQYNLPIVNLQISY